MHPIKSLLLGAAMMLPLLAQAAGSATMTATGKQRTASLYLEYLGKDSLRMGSQTAAAGYFLMLDNKIYAVLGGDEEGETEVLDMRELMQNMSGQMQRRREEAPPQGLDMIGEIESVKNTGRKEQVAGIEGQVWQLDYKTREGEPASTEIVLSENAQVREMSQTMLHFAEQMATISQRAAPAAGLLDELKQLNAGMLRVGSYWTLNSISDKTPAKDRFVLPAEPQAKPSLSTLMRLREMRQQMQEAKAGSPAG